MDLIKKTVNGLLPYSALLPVLFAFIPFVVALLIVLSFSAGDFTNAAYIINHTGIIDIWLQGLVAVLTGIIEFILPYIVYSLIWNIKKNPILNSFIALVMLLLAAAITPLYLFAFALFVFCTNRISDHVLIKREEKNLANLKKKAKNLSAHETDLLIKDLENELKDTRKRLSLAILLGALLLVVYAVVIYPSLIPRSDLTLENGTFVHGKILSEKNGETLIFEQESKKLELLKSSKIKDHSVCIKSAPGKLFQSPFGLLTNTQLIKVCQ